MVVTRLEDLEVWKLAFKMAQAVYEMTGEGQFNRDFAMRDQIRRAGISCMANIAEGFARSGKRDFARFLDIARGSAVEVQSILLLARQVGYVDAATSDAIHNEYSILVRRISALIRYLRST